MFARKTPPLELKNDQGFGVLGWKAMSVIIIQDLLWIHFKLETFLALTEICDLLHMS